MTDIRQRPHRRRRRHAIVAVAFLIAGFAKVDASSLRDGIDACAQTSSLHGAIVGLLIRDAESGAALYELNTATRFVPASNVKLITAAAALKTLGGAYRCTTRITASTGTVAAGVVRGNLYLIGSGDPMLRMEHIDDLARQVAQRDIRSVEGRVIGDASLFSGNRWREGWNWDYLQWYFAPEVSGLSLNRNQVDVIVKPGLPGSPAHIRAEPETPYIRLKNDTQTVRAASSAAATIQFIRQFDSRTIRVAGRIPVASPTITQGMSVPRPALFAAVELTERLRKHGVSVRHSPATGASPGTGLQTIATRISVPLSDMIVYMNKRSDNHAAEQLLSLMGRHVHGQGTADAGLSAVAGFLRGCAVRDSDYRLADGSGLSRHNLLSPQALVEVLRQMRDDKTFVDSLPIAGVDGTLRNRMKNSEAKGNVSAKTGAMSGVCALSGYVHRADGRRVIFSLLINNHVSSAQQVRAVQDRICEAVYRDNS